MLLYLDGDNNLAFYLSRAIANLEDQPDNPDLNVVVLLDDDSNNDTWRFLVQPGGNYSNGVNKWHMGELNMGDPQTLVDFVTWAYEQYPAQHYYLSIADHGRGTSGIAWDDNDNHDYLSTSELRTALGAITNSGQWKIDVLHYDACLMGLFEHAYQVKDYADYLVSSENIGWGIFAYDQYARLEAMSMQEDLTLYKFSATAAQITASTTPRQLAVNVADTYFNSLEGYPRTISALDLSQANTVRQAVDSLATALNVNLDNIKNYVQNARSSTQKFDSRDYFRITNDDEYVDLYHLAERLKQYVPNGTTLTPDHPAPPDGMRNPSAVYCNMLGYTYRIENDWGGGQFGVCELPSGATCKAWDFLAGKCGQEYSACAKRGLDTRTVSDGTDPFLKEYAVCVDAEGRRLQSVTQMTNLFEESGGGVCDEDSAPELSAPQSEETQVDDTLPSSFDWRDHDGSNWLTPIKSQGMCGSCWAFAAVGVTEAVLNIEADNAGLDHNLSEQYLVTDCALDVGACDGGSKDGALRFIRDDGIPDEACLPYHDGDSNGCSFYTDVSGVARCETQLCTYSSEGQCSDYRCSDRCGNWASRLQTIPGVTYLGYNPSKDTIKRALVDYGPIAVSMNMGGDASDRIYTCSDNESTGHAVSIVGYNDAGEYWIVRNSWGNDWGYYDNGYFNVAYDNCAIQKYPYYAGNNVQTAAQGVMDAITSGFVIAEHHQSGNVENSYWDLDNAHGVAIYFPPRSGSSDYNQYMDHQLFQFTTDSQWDSFLADYFGVMGLPPDEMGDPGLPPMLQPKHKIYLPLVIRGK